MRTLRRHFIWRIRKKVLSSWDFCPWGLIAYRMPESKRTLIEMCPLTPHWKSNGSLDFIQIIYLHKVLWVCEDPALGDIKKTTITQMMAAKKWLEWWQQNKIYVQMNSSETKPLPKLKKRRLTSAFFQVFFSSSLHPEQPRMFTKFKQSQGS